MPNTHGEPSNALQIDDGVLQSTTGALKAGRGGVTLFQRSAANPSPFGLSHTPGAAVCAAWAGHAGRKGFAVAFKREGVMGSFTTLAPELRLPKSRTS